MVRAACGHAFHRACLQRWQARTVSRWRRRSEESASVVTITKALHVAQAALHAAEEHLGAVSTDARHARRDLARAVAAASSVAAETPEVRMSRNAEVDACKRRLKHHERREVRAGKAASKAKEEHARVAARLARARGRADVACPVCRATLSERVLALCEAVAGGDCGGGSSGGGAPSLDSVMEGWSEEEKGALRERQGKMKEVEARQRGADAMVEEAR